MGASQFDSILCRWRLLYKWAGSPLPWLYHPLVQPPTSSACGGSLTEPPFVLELTRKNQLLLPPITPFFAPQAAAKQYRCEYTCSHRPHKPRAPS